MSKYKALCIGMTPTDQPYALWVSEDADNRQYKGIALEDFDVELSHTLRDRIKQYCEVYKFFCKHNMYLDSVDSIAYNLAISLKEELPDFRVSFWTVSRDSGMMTEVTVGGPEEVPVPCL